MGFLNTWKRNPTKIILYVISFSLHLLNSFMRSEISLTAPCSALLADSQLNCTVNLIVLLAFRVFCTGPAFLGFHICILYITVGTVVGHYIRTEIYLYVSPKLPHWIIWYIRYHNVCLSYWRSEWPCGLRRRSVAAHCWGRGFRIRLIAWMFVSCICFV